MIWVRFKEELSMSSSSDNQPEKKERPLSPHLQVYRLPYNALMSISGRGAGIVLSLILVVLLAWFNAVVWKPEIYDQTMALLNNPFTLYGALALAFLTFFYLGNGIRHVLWDMGFGVNEKSGILSGNIVLIISAVLTFILWEISCGCWGAMLHGGEVEILEGATNAQ